MNLPLQTSYDINFLCSQLKKNCSFAVDFISKYYFGSYTTCIALIVAVRVNEITLNIVLKFFALKYVGLEFLRGL